MNSTWHLVFAYVCAGVCLVYAGSAGDALAMRVGGRRLIDKAIADGQDVELLRWPDKPWPFRRGRYVLGDYRRSLRMVVFHTLAAVLWWAAATAWLYAAVHS